MKNRLSAIKLLVTLLLSIGACLSYAQTANEGRTELFSKKNSLNSPQSSDLLSTNFGVLSNGRDIIIRQTAAANLGCTYVREAQILKDWNGTNNTYIDKWIDAGKKILLNINNDTTPSAFPKDLVTYEAQLRSVLTVYHPEVAVIENEEANQYDSTKENNSQYHMGSLADYINELTVAVKVCKEKGVPVTNGGLTPIVIASLWNYYNTNNKQDSCTWLNNQMGGVSHDSERIARADSLITAYRQLDLSYVNLHWYEPNADKTRMTGVLNVMINYLQQQTGKEIITNETGVKTNDSSFVTMLMNQWDSANVKYCIFFDANGIDNFGAYPLTSAAGILLSNGIAFRDYSAGINSCPQDINVTPAGPVSVCQGNTVTLTAANGFTNYKWSNGDTTRNTSVNKTGNYYVTSINIGCTAVSNIVIITVNPLPAKPTITTNISPNNVCPNKTVRLTSSSGVTFLWTPGDSTTKVIIVSKAGSYRVTITDLNGCANTSAPAVVTYQKCNAPTNLRVTDITQTRATLNWDTSACSIGYQLQYRMKGTVVWTVVQIHAESSTYRNLYNLTPATTYQWKMLSACKTIPDTVTSNYVTGPEFTTLAKFAAAKMANENVKGINAFEAKVFPNPATSIATVKMSYVTNDLKIILTDLSGKILWHNDKINDVNISIPVSNLANGTYIIIVKDKEHNQTLKLVKE